MSNTRSNFVVYFRPLRNEETLPKQSYKKSVKNVNLLETSNSASKSKSSEKNGLSAHVKPDKKKKKSKESTKEQKEENHDNGDKVSEGRKKHKNKEKIKLSTDCLIDEINLLGTPAKTKSSKDKSKKEKKSTKKKSDEKSKSGYEEALGISTPSKEIN